MEKLYNNDYKQVDIDYSNSIIVIDPPFNIGYHYNEYKDNKKEKEYLDELVALLKDRQAVVIHYPEMICKLSIALGYAPTRIVSWVYNSNTARQHRSIAFFNVKPDFNKVKQPYKNLTDKRIKERIARGITGCKLYDWWNINQVKNVSKNKSGVSHPCVMPLKVMENIIGVLPPNKTIIDCFMGVGTTGVAAKRLGRDFIGVELNYTYYNEAKRLIEAV